jgi:lipid II:glycine glycyltransferase (peptidoglycan interpeptide bridge formation enzyme)
MGRSTKWVLRDATASERIDWNLLVVRNVHGGSILQTDDFAQIKEKQGWSTQYLIYETPTGSIAALALTRYIFGLGHIWYFPKGPELERLQDLEGFWPATKDYIVSHRLNVFLVKIEPELPNEEKTDMIIKDMGFIRALFIQANVSTIILDVYKTPEQQLEHVGRRARRYIRKAEREAITTKEVAPSLENFQQMYAFMQTAFGGQGIPGLRSYEYYAYFWKHYIEHGIGRLYFGFENDKPTVGVFIVFLGEKAVYKDGGSSVSRSSQATAYFVHYHIMNELSKLGITHYDLWGAPPSDQIENPNHPLWGIGNFKTAFSKDVVDYVGVLDKVMNRPKYIVWQKLAYPLTRFYYKKIHKLPFW